MATPSSPNLIDFGDSPRATASYTPSLLDDPFAINHSTDPFAINHATDPFAIAAAATVPPVAPAPLSASSAIDDGDVFPSLVGETLAAAKAAQPAPAKPSSKPMDLYFFVSCMGVDGNSIQTTSRSAQTLMRGAFSMLSQPSKTKSPRGKPPTEVSVEVRITREFPLPGHEALPSPVLGGPDGTAPPPPELLESESYWSERRKSRNPHFAVGFNVKCYADVMRDRHVQIMIMIPEEGATSNKNAQLFGYAQSTFQEMYTIATSSNYQQRMTLPVHSTVMDGATVEIRFAGVSPMAPQLYDAYHSVFKSFLFYPFMKEDQEKTQAVAPKLALEEAAEVDFSVKIPLQLLKVCQYELRQMCDEWRARYNYNRKKNRFFEDDAEALNFGHDIFRVQVVCGRNLTLPSASSPSESTGQNAVRPSTFSLASGGGGIMNRLKTQAGKWSEGAVGGRGAGGKSSEGSPVSAFVVVKICDGNGNTQERIVGKTNTEYETSSPVFSMNKSIANCPHGKPNTKLHVSPVLPSRVEISPVNQLKQFLFYRPSLSRSFQELDGWLKLEVYNESYGIMSGVDTDLIGEVLIPLQSVRDAMTVEETIVWEGEDGDEEDGSAGGSSKKAHSVHSLTLVDWFDIRQPATDEVCGQIQLRLNILLANPMVQSHAELTGDGSDPVISPRRQRLAEDSAPPSANPLESEMSLQFLHPHVLTLQKQIANVNDMIRLCEHLVEQKKTFKSSQHKKRADIQGIPTNLHVSYFRILRHFGSTSSGSRSSSGNSLLPVAPPGSRRASTEDLLGLGSPRASAPPAPPLQTIEERAMNAETHATITCGAPTAHALGLSEYGLREMELEIHRLEGILDRCNPRVITTSSKPKDVPDYVSEEAAEYAFSSLQDDVLDEDDDGGFAASPGSADTPPASGKSDAGVESSPQATTSKSKKTLAARAVAGAKKAAAKRRPARAKAKGNDSDDSASGSSNEIKYPPLKTEPEDGVDPATSIAYAVRVQSRLEMLRAEYYLRKSVAVSQSVSSLVACFVAKLDLCLLEKNVTVLEQLAKVGFLIGWESLISSHGKELRMLSDAWVAIKCLETFAFQLHETSDDSAGKDVILEKREDVGYTIRVPVPARLFALLPASLRSGQLITITSVLFTQGINEMQSLANIVGHSGVSIQNKINKSSFHSIVEYYNRLSSLNITLAESFVGSHPDEILRNLRQTVETENSGSKNTNILFHAADAVRSLNGGRITYCKSGKDRTAMSVTLEQARLLVQRKRHVLEELMEANSGGSTSESGPLEEVKDVANTLREFGVRMDIAKKNVGRYKYSFNSIQRKLLPEIYRPPMSTIQDIVTSVTARDS